MYYFPEKSSRIVDIGYGRIEAFFKPYRGCIEAIPNVPFGQKILPISLAIA